MAVKLRLTRVGSKKNPIYRVVAADSRSPRDGKFIEIVGRYNPQSEPSLIELDEEKVRGWLQKGAQPTLLSTIKIQLKKVDNKHGKYTLNVSADDRNIEKKDKNLDEPVQFYTGKNPVLFEIVVNNMDKNKVSGYLSTPKSVN